VQQKNLGMRRDLSLVHLQLMKVESVRVPRVFDASFPLRTECATRLSSDSFSRQCSAPQTMCNKKSDRRRAGIILEDQKIVLHLLVNKLWVERDVGLLLV
jgi:hypothetical protein